MRIQVSVFVVLVALGCNFARAETGGLQTTPAPPAPDTRPVIIATAPPLPAEPPSTSITIAPPQEADAAITIVFGGDLGLGASNTRVAPDGALRHGKTYPWQEMTAGLAPLINGDLNFANLETVVTDRNDLSANPKSFNFQSHPDGVRHLVELGFNAVSTANNHALDYGETGVRETLRHLQRLEDHGLAAWPGLGIGREAASEPSDVLVKDYRVRMSAIGIGGNGLPAAKPSETRPRAGMLSYNSPEDFKETVDRLAGASADLRILSVHYGSELQVRADQSDVAKLRDRAVRDAGIDIVVGHHAHVAAGAQIVDGKLILYGLGNLLHPGMQDMSRFGDCRNYGLLARVHLAPQSTGRLAVRAVEAMPLTNMHVRAQPLTGDDGRRRIEVLNYLAAGLDSPERSATGIRFTPQPSGSGLYCQAGAEKEPGRIGALCRDWTPPAPLSAAAVSRVSASCGNGLIASRRDPASASTKMAQKPGQKPDRKPAAKSEQWSILSSIFGE